MTNIILNDWGTTYVLTCEQDDLPVNISAATTKEIIFLKPDNTEITRTAVFRTNGTDGKIQYVSVPGDIDTLGLWRFRAHVVGAAYDRRSSRAAFRVLE